MKQKVVKLIAALFAVLTVAAATSTGTLVSCHELKYNGCDVGATVVDNTAIVEEVVNEKLEDTKLSIENKLSVRRMVLPSSVLTSVEEVSNNIIDADDKVVGDYCLYVDDDIIFSAESMESVFDRINSIENKMKDAFGGDVDCLAQYSVIFAYHKKLGKVSDDDIVKALNMRSCNISEETSEEIIPYETVKQYGADNGTVLRKGVDGKVSKTYKNVYIDGVLVKHELLSETRTEPVSEISVTNDVAELPENTVEADASVLSLTKKQQDFVNKILPAAIEGYKSTGVVPSLTLAQAILESGWGSNAIGNNCYGIKATSSWTGSSNVVQTREEVDGETVTVDARFKDYDSVDDCVADYLSTLSKPRYERVRTAATYRDAACAVQLCGYATSSVYAQKLINIIEKYKLYTWDKVNVKVDYSAYQEEIPCLATVVPEEKKEHTQQ